MQQVWFDQAWLKNPFTFDSTDVRNQVHPNERWQTADSWGGHGRPLVADQLPQTSLSTPATQDEMRSWRLDMLAAEAKKAESASEDASLSSQIALTNWKTSLEPLEVAQERVYDYRNDFPEKVVMNL